MNSTSEVKSAKFSKIVARLYIATERCLKPVVKVLGGSMRYELLVTIGPKRSKPVKGSIQSVLYVNGFHMVSFKEGMEDRRSFNAFK